MFWQLGPKFECPSLIFGKNQNNNRTEHFFIDCLHFICKIFVCNVSKFHSLQRKQAGFKHLCAGCDCERNFGPKSWLFLPLINK